MIAHLRGTVTSMTLDAVVLDVGGVGHLVRCTPGTVAGLRRGAEAQLATSLVVREDSLTLYGFADETERDMFELVQTASGVGPKVAQAMLAVMAPDTLRSAIAGEDHAALMAVPGIGRKGAERIVVELKDRVGPVTAAAGTTPGAAPWRDQVLEALQGLGWSAKDAGRAVENVSDGPEAAAGDVSGVLRAALRTLSKA